MKDHETINAHEIHEVEHVANKFEIPVWQVYKAIYEVSSNVRSEVYDYIRKKKESPVEPDLSLDDYVKLCYQRSFDAGWHTDLATGEIKERNKGEMLMLIVSEIAEAMEGERKNLQDDHLPNRKMAEVELADAFIRICDYAGRWGYDLEGAVKDKLEYNLNRQDHKVENRMKDGGKSW